MFPYCRWWIKCNVYRKNSRWNIVVVCSRIYAIRTKMNMVVKFRLRIDKICFKSQIHMKKIKYYLKNNFFLDLIQLVQLLLLLLERYPNLSLSLIKFMFSKKVTKIDKIFTINLTLTIVNVKSTVKISSFFMAFLENMNFTLI